MNEYPPVSVYIITYLTSEERCDVLRQTCKDALALRYPDFEVVVSDNGGAFSAVEALSSLEDSRLKVFLNDTNEGFTGNINRCVKHCSHDIIKLMCDDDLIHPDFLTQTVPLINDETLVVVDVEKYPIGEPPKAIGLEFTDRPALVTRKPGYDQQVWNLPYKSCCIPSATLFTRSFFSRLGGFDSEPITADWDFFMEACMHGNVVYVDRKLCFVGVWSGSLTEEMVSKPYFFPREALYTKFRIYHCKGLGFGNRNRFLCMMFKECFMQGLRVLKNFRNPAYHKGYRDYFNRFFELLRQAPEDFNPRPCNS